MAATKPSTKRKASDDILTADEKEAMRELVRERKAAKGKVDGEADVMAKIAELPAEERSMAERLHALVKASAPDLAPRTWYGMPAYTKNGKVVCFFKAASKFESRYATFGFEDAARLDDGEMWPTSYALKKLTSADEKKLAELVKKAAG
jgi:uncharacterized protein YdhG (YjbR/CyaY superfamily)